MKELSLYSILPIPLVYGVWHTKGGLGGGRILRNRQAIVLQKRGHSEEEGRKGDDTLVHKSFEVNEYLV